MIRSISRLGAVLALAATIASTASAAAPRQADEGGGGGAPRGTTVQPSTSSKDPRTMDQKSFDALSDDTVIEVQGKKMTKREVNAKAKALRESAAASQRGPRSIAGGASLDPSLAIALREKSALDTANAPIVAQIRQIPNQPASPPPPPSSTPALNAMLGQLKPGSAVLLAGNNFGTQQGEVRMYGTGFDGGYVKLSIDTWGNKGIGMFVPNVTGVFDQQVTLRVVRKDGTQSNSKAFPFTAAREVRKLKLSDFGSGSCVNALHANDTCKTLGENDCGASVCADHTLHTFMTFARAHDRYSINLKNGWTYDSHSFKAESAFVPPPWEWANPVLMLEQYVLGNPKPTMTVVSTGSNPSFDVDWTVLYMWSDRYDLSVYVTGPAGTAHR